MRRDQLRAPATANRGGRSRIPIRPGGWIYYLRVGARIKIGHTGNLLSRLADYPPDAVALGLHPGSRDDETALHAQFAPHRLDRREWYSLHPALLEHIKAVCAEHGDPRKILRAERSRRKLVTLLTPPV